jgi:hypothetical protein
MFLFIVRLLRISRCKRVKIKDYFTDEFSPNYICNGRQWICCYNKVKGQCWDSYSIMSDDMIRCRNESAVRRSMMEADK